MNPQSYRSAWRTDKGLYVAYAQPTDGEDRTGDSTGRSAPRSSTSSPCCATAPPWRMPSSRSTVPLSATMSQARAWSRICRIAWSRGRELNPRPTDYESRPRANSAGPREPNRLPRDGTCGQYAMDRPHLAPAWHQICPPPHELPPRAARRLTVSRPRALLGPARIGFWPPAPAPRLTAATSGGDRPVRGPRHRDAIGRTRTLSAPRARWHRKVPTKSLASGYWSRLKHGGAGHRLPTTSNHLKIRSGSS